ncbi:DUF1735 domain-containing protein [Segetibacter aerophilus]|uniref:BT-3987-like N-terminal domain-containing protein n=1 Tax=Segetibacter aerophilus TaxID=670293 RepID=A0A512BBD8_9BACT|nr:DUF1735 domain-containing protein [Segetibacter aerophilus]GEO09147.1 hypothetical protein SAE01_16430 [Segetibacter aerophilus]
MKKIFFNSLLLILSISVTLSSCLKDAGYDKGLYGAIRDTEGKKYVSVGIGGLQNFSKSSILINTQKDSAITVDVTINLDYAAKTTEPQSVKIGIDNSKIAGYNSANSKNFQPVTTEMVKLGSTDLTIPAGASSVTTKLTINQAKFDPATSYLIPITILDAPGATLSSNLNTRYYNIIGNPLAGNYTVVGTRYNYTGTIGYSCGAPIPTGYGSTAASPSPKLARPVDDKTISIDYANLGGSGYQYLISIDPNNPNNAIVKSNATLLEGLPVVNYCVHTYNPATKQFHIVSLYNNGAGGSGGSDRIIDEVFTKQ